MCYLKMGIKLGGLLLVQDFLFMWFFSDRIISVSCYIDPGIELMKCVDGGNDIDHCAFK